MTALVVVVFSLFVAPFSICLLWVRYKLILFRLQLAGEWLFCEHLGLVKGIASCRRCLFQCWECLAFELSRKAGMMLM